MQHFASIIWPVPESVKSNLLAAFQHLFRPLVRLALKNGVTLREFGDVVKRSYIDAAAQQLGNEASTEAIALMLNVDQQEIRDSQASPVYPTSSRYEEPQTTPVAKILAAWHTDVRSSGGPYGVLLDLPFDATSVEVGRKNVFTFTDLARKYCPEVAPRALLEEALRTDCVISVGDGFYKVVKRSHVPPPLSAENIRHFAHVAHNVFGTCEHNLRGESSRGRGLFERTIYSDTRITRADLQAFDRFVRERGQLFADDVDNWLSSRPQPGPKDVDSVNTGVGVYHFVINDDDEEKFTNKTDQG